MRAWIAGMALLVAGGAAQAQQTVPLDCGDPRLLTTFYCEAQSLAERGLEMGAARLACGGDCLIEMGEAGTRLTLPGAKSAQNLGPLTFLHGNRPTQCLMTRLPFVRGDGSVLIVTTEGDRYDVVPALQVVPQPDAGSLSCTGQFLFYRDADSEAMRVLDVDGAVQALPEDWLADHRVLSAIGPSGTSLLATHRDSGAMLLRNLRTGVDTRTDAVFELDQVFLDHDESHYVVVRYSAEPVVSDIYRLSDGAKIHTLDTPLPGGWPVDIVAPREGEAAPEITIYQPG